MPVFTAATITYKGSLLPSSRVSTSPWTCVFASIPDFGAIPNNPQFELEVLQPPNVDGARYRVGGSHFQTFKLLTITPALDFTEATYVGRQMEMIKGEKVDLVLNAVGISVTSCYVIDIRAMASGKRVVGASAAHAVIAGGQNAGSAMASVDAEWMLQVASP